MCYERGTLNLLTDVFREALKDVENPLKRKRLIDNWNKACEHLNEILTYKK